MHDILQSARNARVIESAARLVPSLIPFIDRIYAMEVCAMI